MGNGQLQNDSIIAKHSAASADRERFNTTRDLLSSETA
ncbi:Unknown protein sequence [Pseudomonas amygdali pv. lachrymans]|nr:Unknown protein sequence [Pseudomonas amygdali pv. lachrymans]